MPTTSGSDRHIEAEILLRLVQTVDRWYVGVQDITRSFGILGSGRESVQEVG